MQSKVDLQRPASSYFDIALHAVGPHQIEVPEDGVLVAVVYKAVSIAVNEAY
jgi:hypothetical protein